VPPISPGGFGGGTGNAARQGASTQGVGSPRSKYRNTKRAGPNFLGGFREYDSAWQAKVAYQLAADLQAGRIAGVEPEVSIIVAYDDDGKAIRHFVDFLVRDHGGRCWIVEAKGIDLPTGRTKRGCLIARGWHVELRMKPRKKAA
jgi:hypothetical protein